MTGEQFTGQKPFSEKVTSQVYEIIKQLNLSRRNAGLNFVTYRTVKEVKHQMRCAISYHLYNLKNVKNTLGGVLLLVELQALPCYFTT